MARRQKGPTTEELLQKLDTRFTEYQTSNDENLKQFQDETKGEIERLNNVAQENFSSSQAELQNQNDLANEKFININKTFNDTQGKISTLETQIEEVQTGLKNLAVNFENTKTELEAKMNETKEEVIVIVSQNNENE